jgi:D-galactarolactone cycloisomerase
VSDDLVIATVEAFHLAIPSVYGGPQPRSGAQWPFVNMVMVRVETRGGLVGWGEAFGHNAAATSKAALATLVAPLALGADATDIAGLGARLRRALFTYGLDGPVGFALSGLDIALWDIRGQAAGIPLHRLLAPETQVREVAAYASLLRYGDAVLAGEAAAHAVARGHRAVKLHEATVEAVAAARAAIGPDVPLTLDVNCRWSLDESIANAKLLRPYGLEWLEEPCWPPEPGLLARIGAETGMPIAAGENAGSIDGLERIASAGPAYLQPSAAKIGGVTGLLAARDLASAPRHPAGHALGLFRPGARRHAAFLRGLRPRRRMVRLPARCVAGRPSARERQAGGSAAAGAGRRGRCRADRRFRGEMTMPRPGQC